MGHLLVSLLVAAIAGLIQWDKYGWGQIMISRPIAAGPIIGLLLGDFTTGLYVGATIELMYLGVIGVGAAIPPDAAMATTMATSLTILSGIDPKLAPTLAIPVAMLSQMLQMFVWTLNSGLMHRADKYVANGDVDGVNRMHLTGSLFFYLQGFIPSFLAIYFGVDAVKWLIDHIPQWVVHGLTVVGGVLPALGFAMLFVLMGNKKLVPFFIIGFSLAAFFKASLIAVAFIGVAVMLLYQNRSQTSKAG